MYTYKSQAGSIGLLVLKLATWYYQQANILKYVVLNLVRHPTTKFSSRTYPTVVPVQI